jgi:hypothetical protein
MLPWLAMLHTGGDRPRRVAMSDPVCVGDAQQLAMAAWLGEQCQREGSDAEGQQRRDGVADMGGPLAWWPASVLKPKAAESPGQQQLTAGDEQRNGVLHGWMLADSWPWGLGAWSGGGP